jgi:hypothetical protein
LIWRPFNGTRQKKTPAAHFAIGRYNFCSWQRKALSLGLDDSLLHIDAVNCQLKLFTMQQN